MKTHKQISIAALSVLASFGLGGCNIDLNLDDETKQLINKTATGVVHAVGRLTVNDVSYDTSDATITMDGSSAQESDLKPGMVVSVTGTEYSDGTGKAMVVEYEDIVEGVVDVNNNALDGTLIIMGQTVHVDYKTVFESRVAGVTRIDDVYAGNIVEVSGYASGDGEIWATRIEVKKEAFDFGDKIEVKGKISNLTGSTFMLGKLTVNYVDSALDGSSLANGQYVEVYSTVGFNDSDEYIADAINIKAEGDIEVKHASNDEEVELKGRITKVVSSTQIEVNGSLVNLNSDTNYKNTSGSSLAIGEIIEVEGYIDAQGNFQAKHLELESETVGESDDNSEYGEVSEAAESSEDDSNEEKELRTDSDDEKDDDD